MSKYQVIKLISSLRESAVARSRNESTKKSTPKDATFASKINNYKIKPKNAIQQQFMDSIYKNKITLCDGPAGVGKTMLATCIGVEMLLAGQVDKLILTRPLVEAGNSMGHLPGSLEEKMNPFLINIYEEMRKYISPSEIQTLMGQGKIQVVPFSFMRGRNFIHSYVHLSEAQNVSAKELKLLLTRFGEGSTMVIEGDAEQSDLNYNQQSGFTRYFDVLSKVKDIGVIKFTLDDIVREGIVRDILLAMDELDRANPNFK